MSPEDQLQSEPQPTVIPELAVESVRYVFLMCFILADNETSKQMKNIKNKLLVFIFLDVQIWTLQPDIKELLYPGLGHSLSALSPKGWTSTGRQSEPQP